MATVSVKKKKLITLKLTEKEAEWLKELTQNYLGGSEPPFTEKPEDKKIREAIFMCLRQGLKN